jgi:predicted nucleic acid-binding protein
MNWDRFIGEAIYLDTNIVIFAIEMREPWSSQLRPLFKEFDRGSIRGVTSELTIAEAMTKPIALGDTLQIEKFEELFASDSVLEMPPINREVLMLAAGIRNKLKLKLFDAIHIATARLAKCGHVLTQDERLGRSIAGDLKWLKLSELS